MRVHSLETDDPAQPLRFRAEGLGALENTMTHSTATSDLFEVPAADSHSARGRDVDRCALLLASDPGLGLDRAWRHVSGSDLGEARKAIGLAVMDRLGEILFRDAVR
jgi:hypothetical protein